MRNAVVCSDIFGPVLSNHRASSMYEQMFFVIRFVSDPIRDYIYYDQCFCFIFFSDHLIYPTMNVPSNLSTSPQAL